MKHGQNSRRGRSRGNGKRHSPSRNQTFDSSGPEGKVRGTPQQILDKYLSLARDATSAGEHIAAEGFYQFAEHYFRVFSADQQNRQRTEQLQEARRDQREEEAGQSDGNTVVAEAIEGEPGEDTADDRRSRGRGNGRRQRVASDAAVREAAEAIVEVMQSAADVRDASAEDAKDDAPEKIGNASTA